MYIYIRLYKRLHVHYIYYVFISPLEGPINLTL